MIEAIGRWEGRGEDAQLIWTINGEDVSDRDLRAWCYSHLPYPYNYPPPVMTKLHTDAYAARKIIGEDAAAMGVTFAEMWWQVQSVLAVVKAQSSQRRPEVECA